MIRLRELRKEYGLTLKRFGEIIGVSESTVSLYETGKRQPDLEMLIKIADTLGCSTDYLLGRVDHPTDHFIPKEKLPTELADSGVESVTVIGRPTLTDQEIEVLKQFAQQLQQKG